MRVVKVLGLRIWGKRGGGGEGEGNRLGEGDRIAVHHVPPPVVVVKVAVHRDIVAHLRSRGRLEALALLRGFKRRPLCGETRLSGLLCRLTGHELSMSSRG